MRNQLHWVALGVGVLALATGISVSVWLLQRDDGPDPVLGAIEGAPSGLETGVGGEGVPGLSARFAGGAAGSSSEAEAVQDQDTGVAAPGLTVSEGATLADSAELDHQRGGARSSGGGPSDTAAIGDTADLVVRDTSGKIKQQQTVR